MEVVTVLETKKGTNPSIQTFWDNSSKFSEIIAVILFKIYIYVETKF